MVIKVTTKQNPLANCGNIVTGDRFIGREEEIDVIRNRILLKNGGNIAIMGLPRVGKSSLVWAALMDKREECKKEKIFIIRINVGDISSSSEFYKRIVGDLISEVEDGLIGKEEFNTLLYHKNKIFDEIDNISRQSFMWKFYKLLATKDIHVIYILDEFDHIGTIFKLENFQLLRELSINPDTNIALASVSRRTINEIELLGNITLSKLSTVFSDLNLNLFNREDTDSYWERLKEFGIETDKEYQSVVEYYVGSHPYLMDMFNAEVVTNILKHNTIDSIDELINNKLNLKMYNQYDYIVSTLKEEKIFEQMLTILFGMDYNVDVKSIERLEKFGMIHKTKKGKYKCFSNYFKEYVYKKIEDTTQEENHKVFLSYQSSTDQLANLIEKSVSKGIPNIELLRDRKDLNYKDSITVFMNTIQKCKHVIMVIGAEFLKSRYCMKEAMILFEDSNFKKKIIPIVIDNSVYDAENFLEYTIFWETKKKNLQSKIDLVNDNSRTTKAQQQLVEIDNIFRFLDEFIDYVEDAYIQPIQNYIDENFETIIHEIKK